MHDLAQLELDRGHHKLTDPPLPDGAAYLRASELGVWGYGAGCALWYATPPTINHVMAPDYWAGVEHRLNPGDRIAVCTPDGAADFAVMRGFNGRRVRVVPMGSVVR